MEDDDAVARIRRRCRQAAVMETRLLVGSRSRALSFAAVGCVRAIR